MAVKITAGDEVGAALDAIDNPDDPSFYNVVLKNFVTPWTNIDQTPFAELNDYTATVIGLVRDEATYGFDEVLSADVVYVGDTVEINNRLGISIPPYSHTDNAHYQALESNGIDLSDPALFVPVPQSTLPGSQLSSGDAAGVTTTRAAGEAFFSAGTNRRMWRFTAMNYLCRDMEQLHDITRPNDRIRQDVNRSPGGDSGLYHNFCSGCHGGMDPMAGAYAYFEWDENQERVVHTPGQVQPKYLINTAVFPFGYVTVNNSWENYWRTGANYVVGWPASSNPTGNGPKSLGREVAGSRAFAVCQSEKVFRQVCFREPADFDERTEVERIATVFQNNAYSLKRVFAETAAYCMGN